MAATAAANRTPLNSGPTGGNIYSRPHSGLPNSGQQDPGLHSTNQDPGPSFHPQHPVSARPVFYVPAPPPPPLLPYQWPMPFSYNPFAGFPGMGYGMVMPPFPPPQYMEAPAYILPHPHIQPVDYRRLLHTQVHAPSAPYQNPNQTRRIRPLHTVPIRETVNCAVQTEPTQRGRGVSRVLSPHIDSDSGHGTASSSPSSSSNFRKQGSTEVENYTLPCINAKDLEVNGPAVEHGFNIVHPTEKITAKSCIRATVETRQRHKDNADQENVPSHRNGHCNMWSVGSPDSMVPVCSSSQQEDELVKERRVSVPDILMSWGGGTPQATLLKMTDKVLPKEDHPLPSYQTDENSADQNPTETQNDSVVADGSDNDVDAENILSSKDGETIFKILKLPFALHELLSESRGEHKRVELVDSFRPGLPYTDELLHSLNKSHQLSDEQENSSETNPHDNTAEITPYQMSFNSFLMKRKMSESIWSVESLAPFIPAKDWLLQKGPFEPDIIIEMTEDAENSGPMTQNDNQIVKPCKERRRSYRFSLSDSVPVSDSLLIFSTPAEKMGPSKMPQMGSEIISEMRGAKQGQVMAPLEKDAPFSPTSNMTLSTPTDEDVEEIRSSEPEANRSPNQESFIVNERQERSGSPEHKETLLLNAEVERISPMGQLILQNGVDMEEEDGVCQLQNEQLCVPRADQRIAEVSPSKGHLVDCGTQCTTKCHCEEEKSGMGPRKLNFKNSDVRKMNSGRAEGFCINGQVQKNQRRHGQWRNRGQENPSSQREAYGGHYSKPGKSKGGNGRNPRY